MDPPRQKRPKRTRSGGAKDGVAYQLLSDWAAQHGCRPSPEAIRKWVKRGLVPRMGRLFVGQGPPALAQRVDTGRLVLDICRYREKLGRLDRIAAQLFMDGYEIPPELVAAGFRHEEAIFDRYATRLTANDSAEDGEYRAVYALARSPEGMAAAPNLDFDERIGAIFELTHYLLSGAEMSDYATGLISRATGLDISALRVQNVTETDLSTALENWEKLRVALRMWVLLEPEIRLDKIRSASTRANRRAVEFLGLAMLLSKLAPAYQTALLDIVGERSDNSAVSLDYSISPPKGDN